MGEYAALCSGIGGLELAVEAVFGMDLAWHSEIAEAPAGVHERHWPGVPNVGDLTVVDWRDLEPVDLICAGYPCQPFSSAGERRGEDDERHLWPYVAEAVRVLRPRWVVLENVAGHLSLGFGAVLGDLAEAGYDAEWCCLRASDVGAPHSRLRVFVLATPDPDRSGGETCERRSRAGDAGRLQPMDGGTAADADAHSEGPPGEGPGESDGRCVSTAGDPAWGAYEPAVRRWEGVLARRAPAPVDEAGRLSADFVEWMMGYDQGWTTGLSRPARLRALGNAVVPQQGATALAGLVGGLDEQAK